MKKLSDIGERKAIETITKIISNKDISLVIGDDCAVFDYRKDEYLLVSTDMITKKTHIHNQMTPWQIGWFISAINLSDIAAKGGKPKALFLSYGLPRDTPVEFLKELTKGADDCVKRFDTEIAGGDMKENPNITLCGTIFGFVKKTMFMPRTGAKPDDIIAVTGDIGKAGAGYFALKNNFKNKKYTEQLFEPYPRINEGKILAEYKCVNCCMDLSDGLSSSLYQLMKINKVGFTLYKEKIPVSETLIKLSRKKSNINIEDISLHFGGDYELIMTFPKKHFNKLSNKLRDIGCNLTNIGTVTKKNEIKIIDKDKQNILENKGYEHFKKVF